MKHLIVILFSVAAGLYSNAQRVGIGTTSPVAALHVPDSNVVFSSDGLVPAGSLANNGLVNEELRQFAWDHSAAALLAVGRLSSNSYNIRSAYTVVFGRNNEVDARNSFVAGNSNTCVGIYNSVGGNGSIAGRQAVFGFTPVSSSIALGDVAIAAGNAAVALGNSTVAVADSSYSLGNVSKALFRQATALGSFTEASARAAMAVNYYSEASGSYAFSANDHSVSIGTASVALGSYTNTKGQASMALGENTNARGDMSLAVGQRTIATGFASLVAGVFNDSIVTEQSSLAVNTPLFMVGNGDNNSTRTNALVVRRNGVGIGLNQPAAVLGVEGSFATRGNIVQINNLVNHDVTPGRNSFIKVVNAVNNFTITGFEGGTNGRILTVINLSAFNMTIANDHPFSTAGNRILTLKGADITTVGAGSVTLQYSSSDSRWVVIHMRE